MVDCTMLHDGKPQSGTADLSRMALIHPVEPLKYPFLVFLRDSNPVILYRNKWASLSAANGHVHMASGFIIFNSIITQIVDHLI